MDAESAKKKKVILSTVIPLAVILVIALAGWGAWEWHEQPQMCATCHEMQPFVESWESSDFNIHQHALSGVLCVDCHEADISTLVKDGVGHIQGSFEKRTKKLSFDDKFCFDCHIESSTHPNREAVFALTEGRESDLVVNPHDPYHGSFDCKTCHMMHEKDPSNICLNCHKPGVPLDEIPSF